MGLIFFSYREGGKKYVSILNCQIKTEVYALLLSVPICMQSLTFE